MCKIIVGFYLVCCGLALMPLHSKTLDMENHSQKSIYKGKLNCDQIISTGTFQNCTFLLFKGNKILEDTKIFIDGSMLGHNHGLPTTPKVEWSDEHESYSIKGLKFSMPGKWLLKFKINADDNALQDTIKIPISVN